MKYNKLVRDKIPEYIQDKGGTPVFHTAKEQEYWEKLKEKLLEEAQEFIANATIEEYIDVLEVLEAIADYNGFNKKDIQSAKIQKVKEKGAFKKKIILEES